MTDLIKYHWCEHGMHINETSPSMHYYRGTQADVYMEELHITIVDQGQEIVELEAKEEQHVDMIKHMMNEKDRLEGEVEDLKKALAECEDATAGGTG